MLQEGEYLERFKSKLNQVEYINSWSLFGIHDTAILVRSDARLDDAVDTMRKLADTCNGDKKSIEDYISKRLDAVTLDKCKEIKKIYENEIGKSFKIFEYWLDPLIPIYVDKDKIKANNEAFLIMYIRFDPNSVNSMLNGTTTSGNFQDLYEPLKNKNTVAIFHGFGLFDVVVITKASDYKKIRETMVETRKKHKVFISNTHSLISSPSTPSVLGCKSLNCCILIKNRSVEMKQGNKESLIWKKIKKLAVHSGLNGLCIRKLNTTDIELQNCPLYTSYRPGFFDVAIDLQFNRIIDLNKFIDILEYMPFVEDTVTVINYDTDI